LLRLEEPCLQGSGCNTLRFQRRDADISSGIGLHVPRYTQLLAESSKKL
ncbi:hypothetical protein Tco_0234054, partial [Tanacetum coccineum]